LAVHSSRESSCGNSRGKEGTPLEDIRKAQRIRRAESEETPFIKFLKSTSRSKGRHSREQARNSYHGKSSSKHPPAMGSQKKRTAPDPKFAKEKDPLANGLREIP